MIFEESLPNGKFILILLSTGYQPHFNSSLWDGSGRFERVYAQRKDLLDEGFIRHSISPWGAPVLFVKKQERVP